MAESLQNRGLDADWRRVYTSVRNAPAEASNRRSRRGAANATVLALGFTSFFTDISSEMVAAVIPLFLTVQLGFSPAAFGLFQGVYELANASLRVVGGAVADRTGRPKETAAAGYGISTLTRGGLVGSALIGLPAVPFLLVDRLGKGLRTGPRDAMITLATPPSAWGTAFGIHRSLDAAGALLGPLVAFAVLLVAPGSFDSIFVVSLCFGLIGFGVIATRVHNPVVASTGRSASVRTAFGSHLRNRAYRRIALLGIGFGVFTIGDAFVYLVIWDTSQRANSVGVSGFGIEWFPLLFVGTAVAYLASATPLGRASDHWGRARVWVGGHLLLALAYGGLLLHPTSTLGIVTILVLLGLYYGATDGVLPALAATVIPEEIRSGGLALLATVVALARMLSAVGFGLIWDGFGADRAVVVALSGLLVVTASVTASAMLRNPGEDR